MGFWLGKFQGIPVTTDSWGFGSEEDGSSQLLSVAKQNLDQVKPGRASLFWLFGICNLD
jgi:hypothetical protein